MEKYYCLYCKTELDFKPSDDGGFCSTECEDSWNETGGIETNNLTDKEIDEQGDIDDDFNERSKGIEKGGAGPLTGYF